MKAFLLGISLLAFVAGGAWAEQPPNLSVTPGLLCTASDPNYQGVDYPEKVARCRRNVSQSDKKMVAVAYGNIPESEWPNYEFDHLIPLCAGGSNDLRNLWPQPIAEARKKDVVENDVCIHMRAGTMTQAAALDQLNLWFKQSSAAKTAWVAMEKLTQNVRCETQDGVRVSFTVTGLGSIADVYIRLTDKNGEHEVVRTSQELNGHNFQSRSPKMDGLARYSMVNRFKDRVEIFTPADLTQEHENFTGYLKFTLGGFPKLSSMDCVWP